MIRAFSGHCTGEVEVVDCYRADIRPCVDCRFCWEHPRCAIRDDMQRVYDLMDRADRVVIASPIYFEELTPPLLSVASRLQMIWTARRFRKEELLTKKSRRGALLLTDGGQGKYETSLAMGKRLLHTMGADCEELIYCTGTDFADAEARIRAAEQKAAALAVRWDTEDLASE